MKAKSEVRSESLLVRLERSEKQAFRQAAELSGVELSAWVRERLRSSARRELIEAGQPVAFLQPHTAR
jgi:hypothetical protein